MGNGALRTTHLGENDMRPTVLTFVALWQVCESADEVSHYLCHDGYPAMTPRRVLRWGRGLRKRGLPLKPLGNQLTQTTAEWLARAWCTHRTLDDVCRALNWSPAKVLYRARYLRSIGVILPRRPGGEIALPPQAD